MLAAFLALVVIVLGAYVRLSQAGLGCPDWPGCYGHISVPDTHRAITTADTRYAGRPLHAGRAWKEMIHRYFAGSLAVLILILAVIAWWRRRRHTAQPVLLPSLALLTVIFQALLGMWTVTLLLFPPVVMGHLLGGYATFALLVLLVLQAGGYLRSGDAASKMLRWVAALALVVLVFQIALGGWTSSNYAGIACPDFPTCQVQWWPPMDFHAAFSWHGLGPDYQGGILSDPARIAIHMTHRLGALVTLLMMLATALLCLFKGHNHGIKWLGGLAGALVICQAGIGIGMVHLALPLELTVAHTGVAALLLATIVSLNWVVWARPESFL
ncbi:MAG: COX15/CtaA family protein [Gammaproteobacteria bacterium]|nr:COX15/CtaA family protein [Gammaproteobacteria bacterium]